MMNRNFIVALVELRFTDEATTFVLQTCYEVWIENYGPKLSKCEPNSTASRATNSPGKHAGQTTLRRRRGHFRKRVRRGLFKDLERVVQHGVS